MLTAAQFWSGKLPQRVRLGIVCAAICCFLWPYLLRAQSNADALANQQKAHVVLAATIQALGGPAWLDARTARQKARVTKFFLGAPTGDIFSVIETIESPDKERLDVPKQRVVQIFSGGNGWEITYKGKKIVPSQEMEEYRRAKSHALGVVLRDWYSDPATVLIDEGPSEVERHRTEKITLIHPGNDAVTLEIDEESHLPLQLSYSWRDPQFQDKNVETLEYANYHRVGGIDTPFTVTYTHNGEVVREIYVLGVKYNVHVDENLFDPDYAAAHLK